MLSRAAQRAYNDLIEDVAHRVRNHEFKNHKDLAQFYDRHSSFASHMKTVVVTRLQLLSEQEWSASFAHPHAKQPSWTCPACHFRWTGKQPPASH